MLTVKAAAAQAGVCPALVYGWVAAGVLPHFRLGAAGRRGGIRIAEADLAAFLEARKVAGGGEKPAPPRPAARRRESAFRHLNV